MVVPGKAPEGGKGGIPRSDESGRSVSWSWWKYNGDVANRGMCPVEPAGMGNISFSLRWARQITDTFLYSQPITADVDGDGKLEIFIGAGLLFGGGALFCVDEDGNVKWSYRTSRRVYSTPVVTDLLWDDKKEIVFGSLNGEVYCLGANGKLIWRFLARAGVESTFTAYDLDKDGRKEVLFGDNKGKLYCLRSGGRLWWSFDIDDEDMAILYSPAISDLDGNGAPDIILGAGNCIYDLEVNNGKPKLKWKYRTRNSTFGVTAPVVEDFNGDGKREIVIGSNDTYLYCLSSEGNMIWEMKLDNAMLTPPTVTPSETKEECYDIIISTKVGGMGEFKGVITYRIDYNQRILWKQDTVSYAVPSFDMDGDGRYEAILTKDNLTVGIPESYYFIIVRGNGSPCSHLPNPPGMNDTFPGRVSVSFNEGSYLILAGSVTGILFCWESAEVSGEGVTDGGDGIGTEGEYESHSGDSSSMNETLPHPADVNKSPYPLLILLAALLSIILGIIYHHYRNRTVLGNR